MFRTNLEIYEYFLKTFFLLVLLAFLAFLSSKEETPIQKHRGLSTGPSLLEK